MVATCVSDTTAEAYDRWAPRYAPEAHNPLMRAEQAAMLAAWPDVAGRNALDLACGSGRYARLLAHRGAGRIAALDFSASMLNRAVALRVRGDMMRLPFRSSTFDFVVSGLAVGHAADLQQWTAEVSRVLRAGGVLLYSDFHPQAARAGLQRSFKDERGRTWIVPHREFGIDEHRAALAAAHLRIDLVRELKVGSDIDESFPGCTEFYSRWSGLPLVLVIRAHR